jgi:hypothetical protein
MVCLKEPVVLFRVKDLDAREIDVERQRDNEWRGVKEWGGRQRRE